MKESNRENISEIKRRILQYLECIGITREEFYKKTSLNGANFRGNAAMSELSADKIANILRCYPDLNTDWLLLGKGEMLRKNAENIAVASAPQANASNGNLTVAAPAELLALLTAQQDTIARLSRTIEALTAK